MIFELIGNVFRGIRDIILGKQEVDKKEIDLESQKNNNVTDIHKMEIESHDAMVRRNRYTIILIAVIVIVLEAFGVRLAVMEYLGINPDAVNFDSILKLFSDIISSSLVNP